MSIKITDTQLVMLSAAAQRDDRCLGPPKNLKGGAVQKVAAKLLAAGLVKEIKAKAGAVWRRDEETGQSYSLRLTAAGLRAIAVDDGGAPGEADGPTLPAVHEDADLPAAAATPTASPAATAPREGTKIAQVIGLLQRSHGATRLWCTDSAVAAFLRSVGADVCRGYRGGLSCRSSFIPRAGATLPVSGIE
jgi:hypothetical protein